MPCSDEGQSAHYAAERELRTQGRIADLESRNHLLARIACEALTAIEAHNRDYSEGNSNAIPMGSFSTELKQWWVSHQAFDRKRKASQAAEEQRLKAEREKAAQEEAARVSGLNKLTEAELDALGLNGGRRR